VVATTVGTTAATTGATGAMTARTTVATERMIVATGVADRGCCGDSSMRARTSKRAARLPLSRTMRLHGSVM
jgi:hypothetical protein